jgi:hypothetical protein
MGNSVSQTLLVFVSILAMLLSSMAMSSPVSATAGANDSAIHLTHEQHSVEGRCHLAGSGDYASDSSSSIDEKHCPTVNTKLCCPSTCFNTSFGFPSIAQPQAHSATLALLHPVVIGHKISRLQGILKPPITFSFSQI